MPFYFQNWMRTLTTWVGIAGAVYGGLLIYSGAASLYWLIGTFVVYQICMFSSSVGYHRLFTHKAFETNAFWKWFFAVWGVGFGNGSSCAWVFVHRGHHLYSDTAKDPHETTFRIFFRLKHKMVEYDLWQVKWLLRGAHHYYTHKYAVIFFLAFLFLASLVSLKFFLFCYLIPMAWQQVAGNLLYMFTHDKNGPVDRFWIGFLFPAAGEWLHKSHHENGKWNRLNNAIKPGQFDIGYHFAKLIETKK